MNDIKEIDEIIFGILSAKEIVDMSVCKVDTNKLTGPGSVYDDRMGGNTDNNIPCVTCGQTPKNCPGHFGYIEFNEYIIHPLFYKHVVAFLRCFCIQCNRLLITADQVAVCELLRYKSDRRFKKIIEKLEKVDICCHCSHPQPKITYSITDNTIAMVYKEKVSDDNDNNMEEVDDEQTPKKSVKKDAKISIAMSVDDIKKILDAITDEDVVLCGFVPERVHPRNFILSVFPVIPPAARPFVLADGNICDDDLTNQYLEIIKANNVLKADDDMIPDEKRDTKKQKAMQTLKFRVLTLFNNSQGRAKHPTNGRPIKGLKERMTGKEGQIRNNLMGKRALLPDTPVLMYNTGLPKRADEIKIGDIVIGDDGSPRTVIDTLSGTSPLYKVIQSHGDDYGISCDHILTLKYCGHACINWRENLGKNGSWVIKWYDSNNKKVHVKRVSVIIPKTKDDAFKEVEERRDLLDIDKNKKIIWNPNRKKYGTFRLNYTVDGNKKSIEVAVVHGLTKEQALEQMENFKKTINVNPIIDIHVKDYLSLQDTDRRLMLGIKLNTPIQWDRKDVNLDPRILGMWLGDGASKRPVFTSIDEELINYWKYWASDNECKVTVHDKKDKCIQFGISSICNYKKHNSNQLTQQLKKYNLINNKHIPEDYIINDANTRLLVLAGLIDTDGSVENGGTTIAITQCYEHEQIINGAQRIAISLGFRTSVTTKKTSWTNKDGKQYGKALKLVISGVGIKNIPTLLPHKKCYAPSKKDMSCCEIKVVENGIGKYYGFEIDKNKRFLLGDATITHNCEFSGRTVIGPDPRLRFGEMGVPKSIAEELTIPENVAVFNKEYLSELVNSDKANFVMKNDGETRINLKYAMFRKGTDLLYGDEIIRGDDEIKVVNNNVVLQEGDKVRRAGKILRGMKTGDIIIRKTERLVYGDEGVDIRPGDQVERNGKKIPYASILTYPARKRISLNIGDVVHRHLKDGDVILLNRQPTLHKGSMLAKKIRVMPGKTFRMNLDTCKTFNADFDKFSVKNRRREKRATF